MATHVRIGAGGRVLRRGYTTGSCAAAAAAAAAQLLLTGRRPARVMIVLPSGDKAFFVPADMAVADDRASCSVIKDAGDDPDVTDGMKIVAVCARGGEGVSIRAGEGIGRVTLPGLPAPVGEAAINPAPRRMIEENVRRICRQCRYEGGLRVTLAIPGGEEAARATFNPRLGIEGGLSILGTTGRVEPISDRSMIDAIRLLIDRRRAEDPDHILITPGNYGRRFCAAVLGIDPETPVTFGNFFGDCLDYLAFRRFRLVFVVGHLGKLIKTAGGIMNTHSSMADCRLEILTAHAACAGADNRLARAIMNCPTTDAALALLEERGLAGPVSAAVMEAMLGHIRRRLSPPDMRPDMQVEAVIFAGNRPLAQSERAAEAAALFRTAPGNASAGFQGYTDSLGLRPKPRRGK